jgi:hypothetical protein
MCTLFHLVTIEDVEAALKDGLTEVARDGLIEKARKRLKEKVRTHACVMSCAYVCSMRDRGFRGHFIKGGKAPTLGLREVRA